MLRAGLAERRTLRVTAFGGVRTRAPALRAAARRRTFPGFAGSDESSAVISFHHILVVCEDSPDGDRALFAAAGLARQTGSKLTVAAVADVNMPGRKLCCGSGAACLNYTEREDASARLRRARLLLTDGPGAEFVVALGSRAGALVAAAARLECDVIVIPASPRSRLPGHRTTDDARRLRRLATVPILQTPSVAARGAGPRTRAASVASLPD